LELDRTDREKLLEFQAAGSSRLPEHLQWDSARHLSLSASVAPNIVRDRRGVNPVADADEGFLGNRLSAACGIPVEIAR
jgi:hypothetical protein